MSTQEEISRPIRLIFHGIDPSSVPELGSFLRICYENIDGKICSRCIYFGEEAQCKIRFITDRESRIVFKNTGVSSSSIETRNSPDGSSKWEIKEILIRRDWQFKS